MNNWTPEECKAWWGRSHRKAPSPEEARTAGWVERDGHWHTTDRWLIHDRLDTLGYMEVLPDHYVRGAVHTDAISLLHETVPDWDGYPVP